MRFENRAAQFPQTLAVVLFAIWCGAVLALLLQPLQSNLAAHWSWMLLCLFGIGIVGLMLRVAQRFSTILELRQNGCIHLEERNLWKNREREINVSEISSVKLDESEDQDGDAYFRLVMTLSDGIQVVISEGWDRERLHAIMTVLERYCRSYLRS